MAENPSNVYVAQPAANGAIWSAPIGTNIPTNATSDLPSGFVCLGLISTDGITNKPEFDVGEIKAYGKKVVKKITNSFGEYFEFTPIETNSNVLAEQWGDDNVTVDANGNISVKHNAKEKPPRIYVIETLLGDNMVERDVIPRGRVIEVGEKKYADEDPLAASMKIDCEVDSTGNTSYSYFATIPINVSNAVIADIPDQTATGSAITPTLTVTYGGRTLVLNTDYSVAYTNNTAVGTATATITGIGDYTGTKAKTFNIVSGG